MGERQGVIEWLRQRRHALALGMAGSALSLAACGASPNSPVPPLASASSGSEASTPHTGGSESPLPIPDDTTSPSPATSESAQPSVTPSAGNDCEPTQVRIDIGPYEGGQRFYANDRNCYRSPWFEGTHLKMTHFGCTTAPYYKPDSTCPPGQGKHHGADFDMPIGTPIFGGVGVDDLRVVDSAEANAPGLAYGKYALRLRSKKLGVDFIIGHVGEVFVHPGDQVTPGQKIALSDEMGPAPVTLSDGTKKFITEDLRHVHIEVRPAGSSYKNAIDPTPYLGLRKTGVYNGPLK